MTDLRNAILDAKYVDMIGLADFVVRDCGLPDMDDRGEMLPQANEIAAAVFRWAAGAELGAATPRPRTDGAAAPRDPRASTEGEDGGGDAARED